MSVYEVETEWENRIKLRDKKMNNIHVFTDHKKRNLKSNNKLMYIVCGYVTHTYRREIFTFISILFRKLNSICTHKYFETLMTIDVIQKYVKILPFFWKC